MKLLELVRTASREANFLAVTATFLLLIKILLLNRFTSLFFGAYELGLIVEAVLASVIASYVFYLLVVHVKEHSDRQVLRPFVEKHTKRLIGDCLSQLSAVSNASAVPLDLATLSQADVTLAFSKIAPYSSAPLLISAQPNTYAHWLHYFEFYERRGIEFIRKLFDQLPFLDASHVSILTEIDDCSHFIQRRLSRATPFSNTDLTAWASSFYEYCVLCRKLNAYLVQAKFSPALP